MEPYRIEVSDRELERLRLRSPDARWPDRETVEDWSYDQSRDECGGPLRGRLERRDSPEENRNTRFAERPNCFLTKPGSTGTVRGVCRPVCALRSAYARRTRHESVRPRRAPCAATIRQWWPRPHRHESQASSQPGGRPQSGSILNDQRSCSSVPSRQVNQGAGTAIRSYAARQSAALQRHRQSASHSITLRLSTAAKYSNAAAVQRSSAVLVLTHRSLNGVQCGACRHFASKGLRVRVPLAPPLVGGGLCQAMARACLVRPWSAGLLDLLSLLVSRPWMA